MRLLRSLGFSLALFLWTLVAGILGLPLLLLSWQGSMWLGSFWSAQTLRLLGWIVGITHELRGLENLPAGPAIIAMKHQSAWDTFAVSVLIRKPAIVLKKELMAIPVYGWYLRRAGMIGIDRGAAASALKTMVAAGARAIAQGRPIVIFPEGTRTAVGARLPYHPGVAALYRQLDLALVPVA
ncbi:MAG TPA: lysophospholipid acyltransferase family protein, partial [Stellaceae bacterium]|nr:lysophospholipid acyltransferase family protein [Stellaceae bacterium]